MTFLRSMGFTKHRQCELCVLFEGTFDLHLQLMNLFLFLSFLISAAPPHCTTTHWVNQNKNFGVTQVFLSFIPNTQSIKKLWWFHFQSIFHLLHIPNSNLSSLYLHYFNTFLTGLPALLGPPILRIFATDTSGWPFSF